MKILIVEDEELAVQKLKQLIRMVEPAAEIGGVTPGISATVKWLQTHSAPDLIFMDIELSDGQSFDIFNRVEVTAPVIFTTSYDEYAIRAFKVNSVDYLLKPVTSEDLKQAFDKLRRFTSRQPAIDVQRLVDELRKQLPTGYRNRFLVKQGQRLISLETTDIAYFFADGRLSYGITWDKHKYVIDYTLEELEGMLSPEMYFRANRSFLVHLRSVKDIHNHFNGKLKLGLHPANDKELLVSKERVNGFKVWMGK